MFYVTNYRKRENWTQMMMKFSDKRELTVFWLWKQDDWTLETCWGGRVSFLLSVLVSAGRSGSLAQIEDFLQTEWLDPREQWSRVSSYLLRLSGRFNYFTFGSWRQTSVSVPLWDSHLPVFVFLQHLKPTPVLSTRDRLLLVHVDKPRCKCWRCAFLQTIFVHFIRWDMRCWASGLLGRTRNGSCFGFRYQSFSIISPFPCRSISLFMQIL